MTNILIVQGHPDQSKVHLCHAIADSYQSAAVHIGHSVQVIAIANQDIPYLRSKAELESSYLPQVATDGQAAVAAADHIVIIYPLWMGDVPAILKAWIEQVLRAGFAFDMGKGAGKRHLTVNQHGSLSLWGCPVLPISGSFLHIRCAA